MKKLERLESAWSAQKIELRRRQVRRGTDNMLYHFS